MNRVKQIRIRNRQFAPIPNWEEFSKEVQKIAKDVKRVRSGSVADYIPQLSRVDPNLFAVAICSVDGKRLHIGDSSTRFCMQSTIKPLLYCMALEERGTKVIHRYVGHEPSGAGFNELTLNSRGVPHNPMLNAGAIMTCSLIGKGMKAADRFESVFECLQELAGSSPAGFNNSVFLSERRTADRNYALGYFMREHRAFPPGTHLEDILEFYFQCCSLELNAEGMANVAASLATGGVCPETKKRVFDPSTVKYCLSLMSTCGMYDFSGEFAFRIGLPAKSGVSGAIMIVVPNVMGICVYSPKLDGLGNSVRGIEFCNKLVERFNFHSFDLHCP